MKVTFFSFIALSVFSSFFSFQFSLESELEDVFCLLFLDFSFCLSIFLIGGFASFALLTTCSAGSSDESPALPLFSRAVSLSELTAEPLFELFGDILENFLRYKFSQNTNYKNSIICFYEQSRKSMEDWASLWDEQFKLGKRSIWSTEIL